MSDLVLRHSVQVCMMDLPSSPVILSLHLTLPPSFPAWGLITEDRDPDPALKGKTDSRCPP